MDFEKVEGKNVGDVRLFGLSTCTWCKKTKELLDELGVEYRFLYVDNLSGAEKEEAVTELQKCNPKRTFPTVVIDGEKCIVGFREDEIREALDK